MSKNGRKTLDGSKERLTVEALQERLYARPEFGGAFAVDLRGKTWGNQGRVTLRNPADPGWPQEGRTTSVIRVAKEWLKNHYHGMVVAPLHLAASAPDDVGLTGEEMVERYIREKTESLGADHDTVKNRASALRTHFVKQFGDRDIVTISKPEIRKHLNALKVHRWVNGERKSVKAELGTKRALRTAYLAMWKHVLPDVDCPWEGIYLNTDAEKRALRDQIKGGDFHDLLKPESGALTPAQVVMLLVAALWYDLHQITNKRDTSKWAVPNTAAGIALQIATGMRKAELVLLRWWMIDFEAGCIRTPSKKGRTLTRKGRLLRAIPLQKQLLPWLELLKRLACPNGGEPNPMAFVLKTNVRPTAPSRKTLGERFAMALMLAGLKQPKKQSHGFRATHATWGAAEHKILSTEQLKAFLGHANVWMGATDDYVEMMAALMTPEHRTYIRHLPSPTELEAAVAAFVPPALPPRPKRPRKPKPKA